MWKRLYYYCWSSSYAFMTFSVTDVYNFLTSLLGATPSWYHSYFFFFFFDYLIVSMCALLQSLCMVVFIVFDCYYYCFYYCCCYYYFLNWDLIHARLSSHYEAWSYEKKKHKKLTAYRKYV